MRKGKKEPITMNIDFNDSYKNIHVDEIEVSQSLMRNFTKDDSFNDLVLSITTVGLINPITVVYRDKQYKLIAGLRRLMAVKEIGTREINCHIIDANTKEFIKIQYDENITRQEISVVDEGLYLKQCKVQLNFTNDELANLLNKSESYISKRILITECHDLIIEAIKSKRLSINAALIISKCKDEIKMKYLIDYFDEQKLRDVDLKTFVEQIIGEPLTDENYINTQMNDSNVYTGLYSEPRGVCDLCGKIHPLVDITEMRICKGCATEESEIVPD